MCSMLKLAQNVKHYNGQVSMLPEMIQIHIPDGLFIDIQIYIGII